MVQTPPDQVTASGVSQALVPSDRDRELFARFLEEFPPDQGSIKYLQTRFFGKQWRWSELGQIHRFADAWECGVFFDDNDVDQARQALLSMCHTFLSDAAGESHVSESDDDLARLIESSFRDGGQSEWESARKTLREGAEAVIEAHDKLHRVGRARGL